MPARILKWMLAGIAVWVATFWAAFHAASAVTYMIGEYLWKRRLKREANSDKYARRSV